jgi:DNA-binding IclR family transcriptional regulator
MAAVKKPGTPLQRYFRLLEVVAGFPAGITLAQLVGQLGLPKTTVHRLLRGLTEVGMLTDAPGGTYRLGPRLLSMLYTGASGDWIQGLTQPLLRELAEETGETCYIARLVDRRIQSVAIVTPENAVRGYVVPGRELWPHAAASAKAILAFQSDAVIAAVLASGLPRFTNRTQTDRTALLKELAAIRQSGIASCIGEDVDGFAGIACPIPIDGVEVIYGLAITGTIDSLIERNRARYESLLVPLARRIAAAMGIRLAQIER